MHDAVAMKVPGVTFAPRGEALVEFLCDISIAPAYCGDLALPSWPAIVGVG